MSPSLISFIVGMMHAWPSSSSGFIEISTRHKSSAIAVFALGGFTGATFPGTYNTRTTSGAHDHGQSIQDLFVSFEVMVDEAEGQQSTDGVESHKLPPFVHAHFTFVMNADNHLGGVAGFQPILWLVDGMGNGGE